MNPRGIPIEQVQLVLWGALEAAFDINPGEYVKYGGVKIGAIKPIVLKFLDLIEDLENAAVDGLISWDEIDVVLERVREIVEAARQLAEPPV